MLKSMCDDYVECVYEFYKQYSVNTNKHDIIDLLRNLLAQKIQLIPTESSCRLHVGNNANMWINFVTFCNNNYWGALK